MAENKFREYLRSRKPSDAVRQFVDDAVTDTSLPNPKSWDELQDYLKNQRRAPEHVLREAEYVWRQYLDDQRGR